MKISNEFKIGFWSLVAIIVLVWGINFLKGINMMKKGAFYYVLCDNVEGLAVSSHVMLNGYQVGLVRDMYYDYEKTGKIVVTINVEDALALPIDSKAYVQTDMLGTSIIKLDLGQSNEILARKDTIAGADKVAGIMSKAEDMLPTVNAILPKIDSLIAGLNLLVNESKMQETLLNINTLTCQLQTTTTELNKLMKNDLPKIAGNVTRLTANLDEVSSDLKDANLKETLASASAALSEAQKALEQLNSDQNTLGKLMQTPELHDNLVKTIADADSLIGDIKKNPKRYINVSVFGGKK